MPVEIKRKKIKGKFFIVAEENGKITSKKKWSRELTLEKAKRIYKQNRTFDQNIERRKLATRPYEEYTDTSKKPSTPRARPFRFFISGLLKDGRVVSASSRTQHWSSVSEAENEAEKRFLEMLAFTIKDIYDADEGIKLVSEVKSMQKGVIYYR